MNLLKNTTKFILYVWPLITFITTLIVIILASHITQIHTGNNYNELVTNELVTTGSKIYIGYHGSDGKLYADPSRDLAVGERLYCVGLDDLITDGSVIRDKLTAFNEALPVDCHTDSSCRSNVLSIKLGLCLEDVVKCEDVGISKNTRNYYQLVSKRIQTHPYGSFPYSWNKSNHKYLAQTIIGSQLIEVMDEFDTGYDQMIRITHKLLESIHSHRTNYKKLISIDKKKWYHYRSMALSRGFDVMINDKNVYVMAPQIDMADHGFKTRTGSEICAVWGYEDQRDRLCVYATSNIKKGSEIKYDYGITDARHACLNYGIYDDSLDLDMYFRKISGTDILLVSRKDLTDPKTIQAHTKTLKIIKSNDHKTVTDMCVVVKKTKDIYKTILNEMYDTNQEPVKKSCFAKILNDEMQIIESVDRWSCS